MYSHEHPSMNEPVLRAMVVVSLLEGAGGGGLVNQRSTSGFTKVSSLGFFGAA